MVDWQLRITAFVLGEDRGEGGQDQRRRGPDDEQCAGAPQRCPAWEVKWWHGASSRYG